MVEVRPEDFFDEDAGATVSVTVTAPIWQWRPEKPSAASWYFLTIDGAAAADLRAVSRGRSKGFGSVKVSATLGSSVWRTSLFPHKESGGFLLPMKASVRKAEGVDAGDEVRVQVTMV